jgi:hypothetical protein
MKKPILNLPGSEIFGIYTAKRDDYSQTLFTAYSLIGDDLFPMLEQAEKQNKLIGLKTVLNDVDDPVLEVVIE